MSKLRWSGSIYLICPGMFSMGIETVKTNMITMTFPLLLHYYIPKIIIYRTITSKQMRIYDC